MIHLIKLAVGIRDLAHLKAVQKARSEAWGDTKTRRAYTKHKPTRAETLDGSLYWVVKGLIRCRQKIIRFDTELDNDGKPYCLIVLKPALVPTVPTPRQAFQGWRYLDPAAAPPDLPPGADGEPPPEEMLAELRNLGLL